MKMEMDNPQAKPTGRRYGSVSAMLAGEGVPESIQEKLAGLAQETRVTLMLAMHRQKAGITQADMAKQMGVSQSAISKLESGKDEDLTLSVIRDYARVTGQRIGVSFGKRMTHAEAIKQHAFGLKFHLEKLAEVANQNADMKADIARFYGEAFFNLFNILASCNEKLPSQGDDEIEIRLEICQSQKLEVSTERITAANSSSAATVLV